MARIQITLPGRFEFTTTVNVRIADINYGGHLGNDAVLSLVQEARLRWLKQHGFTELNIDGYGLILTDAAVVYKSESFHGDILVIEAAVADFNKYGCDFVFRLTHRDTGREVARAKTGIVFFDYSVRKMVGVPPGFSARFGGAQPTETAPGGATVADESNPVLSDPNRYDKRK